MMKRIGRWTALCGTAAMLAGCKLDVMFPSGDIAIRERDVIVMSTILTLLIVIPVMLATAFFAWWFRASNVDAKYDPEWHHSTQLEVVIWAAPLMIIVALGALTWISTHTLDPFRPLTQVEANRPVPAGTKPLVVQAVALDWKWLFIYPEQGVAVVNELAAPVDTPIQFKITSASVMNTLWIPSLAGMIYAMPAMESQLHAVMNEPGEYDGLSGHYSGAGFSDMKFKFHSLSNEDFGKWVAKVKASQGGALGAQEYVALTQPSQREPVRYYRTVDAGLFDRILRLCAEPGATCTDNHAVHVGERPRTTKYASLRPLAPNARGSVLVAQICTTADASGLGGPNAPRAQVVQ